MLSAVKLSELQFLPPSIPSIRGNQNIRLSVFPDSTSTYYSTALYSWMLITYLDTSTVSVKNSDRVQNQNRLPLTQTKTIEN